MPARTGKNPLVPAPAGIVSTRDIVTRVVATELDAAVLTAGDIVWSTPVAARTTDTVSESLRLLLANSNVIPLIDSDGALAGVVTLDDLLLAASDQSEEK